jgi:hypothetical protein
MSAPLGLSAVSIADYPSLLNNVVLDVDPNVYNPFEVPLRGSSTKVLDGTVVHQLFGLNPSDWTIQLSGYITSYQTVQALWTKYRQGGGGQTFQMTDWVPNKFQVIWTPGVQAFKPVPVIGDNQAHTYTMSLTVISVIEFFGGAY